MAGETMPLREYAGKEIFHSWLVLGQFPLKEKLGQQLVSVITHFGSLGVYDRKTGEIEFTHQVPQDAIHKPHTGSTAVLTTSQGILADSRVILEIRKVVH